MLMQVTEQMDIFQLQQNQSEAVRTVQTDKLFSVGYYDYKDCFFRITVPAPDMETAKQKVLKQEVRHPKSYGCLRTWRIKEIK